MEPAPADYPGVCQMIPPELAGLSPPPTENVEMETWHGDVWRNKGVGRFQMPRIDSSRQVCVIAARGHPSSWAQSPPLPALPPPNVEQRTFSIHALQIIYD